MGPLRLIGIATLIYLLANAIVSDSVVNETGSMPLGRYLQFPAWRLHVGDFATACLPPDEVRRARAAGAVLAHGRCPGDSVSLIKVVVGLPGDHFAVTPRGIEIDGTIIADSAPLASVNLPRPAPTTVPAGYAVLWSPVRVALDSRYLGPLPVKAVAYHIDPLDAATRERLTPRGL
jgi:type IV secretory pathway protease TraF